LLLEGKRKYSKYIIIDKLSLHGWMSNNFVNTQVATIAVRAILVFRIEDETKMRPSERS